MHQPVISATGVYTPRETITNDELVVAFNAYADLYNAENADAIAAGELVAKDHSSSDFITKASGIEQRFVLDKSGILDPEMMRPNLHERSDDEPSQMAEMAVIAAQAALTQAGVDAGDIDCIIVAASNHERAYPAIAVEVQELLGATGFGFDMNVACSSATFGMQSACDMIRAGTVRKALVINPEDCLVIHHLEQCDLLQNSPIAKDWDGALDL
jgi:beta-ketodecanoyl-[acyl-carrier-protein] synthase